MTKNIEYYLGRYFSRIMKQQGEFLFSHITCPIEYYDPNHKIHYIDEQGYIKERFEARTIKEDIGITIPLFVPNGVLSSYGQYLQINHMHLKTRIHIETKEDIEPIDQAINEILQQIGTIISEETLDFALKDLGYTNYQFHFQNLGSLGDGRIVTRFTGTIPKTNSEIGELVTDQNKSEQLEQLYQQNKLPFKIKRYQETETEEFDFQNRNWIRKQTNTNEHHWIMIKQKERGENHVKRKMEI